MDQIDEGPVEVSGLAIREALKRLGKEPKNPSEAQEIRVNTKNGEINETT